MRRVAIEMVEPHTEAVCNAHKEEEVRTPGWGERSGGFSTLTLLETWRLYVHWVAPKAAMGGCCLSIRTNCLAR